MSHRGCFILVWVILFTGVRGLWAGPPTPATQPAEGPGGAAATYKDVVAQSYGVGGKAYWIFTPGGIAAGTAEGQEPVTLPVIVFCHGWGALEPGPYSAWIDHLVQRGNIVLFPMYQASMLTLPQEFTPNAVASVQAGLEQLAKDTTKIKPDLTRVALVGHSVGGVLAANLAALSAKSELPEPKAVMCVEPGKTWPAGELRTVKLEDLKQLPAQTLLLAVVGDADKLVFEVDAKRIFKESTQVAPANKNYVRIRSDNHGKPGLSATHFLALASNGKYRAVGDIKSGAEADAIDQQVRQCDTLDFYGTWKLFDGLTDAAFYGKNRKYALGNTPEQRFMGKWSDGVAIKELVVVDKP